MFHVEHCVVLRPGLLWQTQEFRARAHQSIEREWQWMADKNVDKLAILFHNKSKFVHMSGTWKNDEELEVIKSGSIWYKKADVHDVAVEIVDKTAVVWNRITLLAVVSDTEVTTEFTVTEVYKKKWKMLALTFSSERDTHAIKH